MEHFDKYLENYKKNLKSGDSHLSYELLSAFILSNQQFSKKERIVIVDHASHCVDCSSKFNRIYDYEFMPVETVVLQTKVAIQNKPDHVIFYDQDKKIQLELFPDKSQLKGRFLSLPVNYAGSSMKVLVSGLPLTGRFVNVLIGEIMLFKKDLDFDHTQIESVKLEIAKDLEVKLKPEPSVLWLRYAAVAVILVFLGTAALFYKNKNQESQMTESAQETKNDTLKIVEKTNIAPDSNNAGVKQFKQPVAKSKLLAQSFVENPLLENFIDQNFRSEATVTELFPLNGDTLRNPFVFKWASGTAGAIIKISILDNLNREVWQFSTVEHTISINLDLTPGLYYWKLSVNDELFSVRKFFVLR